MPLVGYDSAEITTGHAHEIAAHEEGFKAAGLYGRPDRCTKEMVDGLRSVGIKIWALYEKGFPVDAVYFTAEQGTKDGLAAATFWKEMGLPAGKPIFACVDYDPTQRDIEGPITAYITAFRKAVMASGYVSAIYGSGMCCSWFVTKGLAHFSWLAQSSGWSGNAFFRNSASILQGETFELEMKDGTSYSCDRDTVVNLDVLW